MRHSTIKLMITLGCVNLALAALGLVKLVELIAGLF
jgi:hypothetical protein